MSTEEYRRAWQQAATVGYHRGMLDAVLILQAHALKKRDGGDPQAGVTILEAAKEVLDFTATKNVYTVDSANILNGPLA